MEHPASSSQELVVSKCQEGRGCPIMKGSLNGGIPSWPVIIHSVAECGEKKWKGEMELPSYSGNQAD